MTKFSEFVLLGLGAGGVYALMGLGIVLVYRGSGVVNFAQGALALVAAIIYHALYQPYGTPLAVVGAVAGTAILGGLIQVLIMRPLRNASPLARVVATLAILAVIEQLALQKYGTYAPFVHGFLSHGHIQLWHGVFIGNDRLIILVFTVSLTAVLWVAYRYSRFGLATTSVAENERVTAAQGWSPSWLGVWNWMLGGALAGIAGVLLVPITGLAVPTLTLAVVPALAAALLGGFCSFPGTLAGGLVIGILEAETTGYVSTPGWAAAVPFVAIIAILVIRGRPLPLRSHLADRLPRVGPGRIRWPHLALGIGLTALSVVLFTGNWANAVVASATVGLICLSLVVVTGFCGQLSLAQFALAGVGALIAARSDQVWGLPFPVALLFGMVATVPIGLVVALPAIRARGVSLAVATLGLADVITSVILSNDKYTGGVLTGTVVHTPTLFGWSVQDTRHPLRYLAVVVVIFVVAGLTVANLRRGRTGRRLIAVRDNERAAASLGMSVVGGKLYAFGLGAALASLGGILLAFQHPHVDFGQYSVFSSVNVVLTSVIGGIGYASGAVVGGFGSPGGAAEQITNHAFSVTNWFIVISSALLILVLMIQPDGAAARISEHYGILSAKARRRLRRSTNDAVAGRDVVAATESTNGAAPHHAKKTSATAHRRVRPLTLEISDLGVRFGGVVALDGVSLTVAPGEVVGLIGPNGAGKTTLIDAVTGFVPYHRGTVTLDGRPVDALNAAHRARAGLTRSFQSLELFEDLTVLENLRAATDTRDLVAMITDLVRPGDAAIPDAAALAIEDFQLTTLLHRRPEALPYGKRRLVAIARAVAALPSVLLLDEPAAGLDEWSTTELAGLVRALADQWGMGVLLVEHDVQMVLNTCDRVQVLEFGQPLAHGTPEEIRGNPAVVAAYLGDAHAGAEPSPDLASATASSAPGGDS